MALLPTTPLPVAFTENVRKITGRGSIPSPIYCTTPKQTNIEVTMPMEVSGACLGAPIPFLKRSGVARTYSRDSLQPFGRTTSASRVILPWYVSCEMVVSKAHTRGLMPFANFGKKYGSYKVVINILQTACGRFLLLQRAATSSLALLSWRRCTSVFRRGSLVIPFGC
jgi:hypothetical protein